MAPHAAHEVAVVSFTPGRRPQCAQKGSPAAVGFPHHSQGTVPGGAWTRVAGTIAAVGGAAQAVAYKQH
ncbi:MAG: hypothetical protein IRY91_16860, partial [Gemmatimonadaceae bacterium]|nr:hypothetical protein [Gemmatimonadaceae bacterium]